MVVFICLNMAVIYFPYLLRVYVEGSEVCAAADVCGVMFGYNLGYCFDEQLGGGSGAEESSTR